jgi:hypothetical protein
VDGESRDGYSSVFSSSAEDEFLRRLIVNRID